MLLDDNSLSSAELNRMPWLVLPFVLMVFPESELVSAVELSKMPSLRVDVPSVVMVLFWILLVFES